MAADPQQAKAVHNKFRFDQVLYFLLHHIERRHLRRVLHQPHLWLIPVGLCAAVLGSMDRSVKSTFPRGSWAGAGGRRGRTINPPVGLFVNLGKAPGFGIGAAAQRSPVTKKAPSLSSIAPALWRKNMTVKQGLPLYQTVFRFSKI